MHAGSFHMYTPLPHAPTNTQASTPGSYKNHLTIVLDIRVGGLLVAGAGCEVSSENR